MHTRLVWPSDRHIINSRNCSPHSPRQIAHGQVHADTALTSTDHDDARSPSQTPPVPASYDLAVRVDEGRATPVAVPVLKTRAACLSSLASTTIYWLPQLSNEFELRN